MKKLLAGLLLFVALPTFAAVRTANTDGNWSSTATWSGLSMPVAGDQCTINAGVEVFGDAAAMVCGELTVNGSIIFKDGVRDLTVGDGAAGVTDFLTINSGGSILMGAGHSLLFNRQAAGATPGTVTQNGVLIAEGRTLREGGVTSFGEPSGSWPNRTVTITDQKYRQSSLDEFSGKILVPTTGWFRWQPFDITTGAATLNEIVLKIDSYGATDSRNKAGRLTPTAWAPGDWSEIWSTGLATVANGGTVVTLDTAISDTPAGRRNQIAFGSRFACNADLNAADDPDVRRICSVDSATQVTLCTAYGTGSCAAGAAFRIFSDAQPPTAVTIRESFAEGDNFVIIDPATISITAANRSDTTDDQQYHLNVGNGSTTVLRNALVNYCGEEAGGSTRCLTVSDIDNSRSDEAFIIDGAYFWHPGGENVMSFRDVQNMTVKRFFIGDCAEGASLDGGECHGIDIQDLVGNTERTTKLIFEDGRIVRTNDDSFTMTVATESDNRVCDGCEFRRLIMGFGAANGGGSLQAFEPAVPLTNFAFRDCLITNFPTGVSLSSQSGATESWSGYFLNNVIQNIQIGAMLNLGSAVEGTGSRDSVQKISAVGNLLRNGLSGVTRGYLYNNLVDIANKGTAAPLTAAIQLPQAAFGNIVLEPPQGFTGDWRSGINHDPTGGAGGQTLSPATVKIYDNVIRGTNSPNAATTIYKGHIGEVATTGVNYDVQHNSVWCGDLPKTTGYERGFRIQGPAGATQTYKANILLECDAGFVVGAGNAATFTINYNIYSLVPTPCSGCSTGANDILTATSAPLGWGDYFFGAFLSPKGSAAQENLADDGDPRGVRVAGPNYMALKAVYPWLERTPFVNNIGDVDSDGDGIYNVHDNCDPIFNPSQLDDDGDGIGNLCE